MKTLLALLLLIPSLSWGIGKSPLEKCMDRVIDGTFNGNETRAAAAAQVCAGVDSAELKCMDRVIDGTFNGNERRAAAAAQVCTGNR